MSKQEKLTYLQSLGRTMENLLESIGRFITNPICAIDEAITYKIQGGFDDEGRLSEETKLYLARSKSIGRVVFGNEFYQLENQVDEFYQPDNQVDQTGEDSPERARQAISLCRRQFELFRAGYERARSHPERYRELVTWEGPPGLRGALIEEALNTYVEEYPYRLSNHLSDLRAAGHTNEADAYQSELLEARRFLRTLGIPC